MVNSQPHNGLFHRKRSRNASRKRKFDNLFLKKGEPTGYLRSLIRHFDAIKAIVEDKPVTPVSIEIQPSGTCNISCRYCGFQEKRKQHEKLYISEEEMRQLIEEINEFNQESPHRLTEIKFNGIFSEPLAGPGKRATVIGIKMAVEKGFWTGLFTNGLGLTRDVQDVLVGDQEKSAAFVNVSHDAGTWETYHKLKRKAISKSEAKKEYLRILDNVRSLTELRNRIGSHLNVSISCILQKENSTPEEIEALIHLAKELGADNVRFRYPYKKATGAPDKNDIRIAYATISRFIEKYKDDDDFTITQVYTEEETDELRKRLGDGTLQKKTYNRCWIPYLRLTLAPDGNFYPCDHRGYIGGGTLGHLREGYKRIMEGQRRREAIKEIRPLEDPRCEFCAMYNHTMNELINILEEEYQRDPNLFVWLKSEYLDKPYDKKGPRVKDVKQPKKQGIDKRQDREIIAKAIEKGVNRETLSAFLKYLDKSLLPAAGAIALRREVIEIDVHRDRIEQAIQGRDVFRVLENSFKGYTAGQDYDGSECISGLFRDIEFIDGINLLVTDLSGRERVTFSDQTHLVTFIRDSLAEYFKPYLRSIHKARLFSRFIDTYAENMVNLLGCVSDLAYEYYDHDVKDCILRHLTGFVRVNLDESMQRIDGKGIFNILFDISLEDFVSEKRHYKVFTDILLRCIHYQIVHMQEHNEFLPRQLFITLRIFEQKFREYVERIGFANNYTPIFILGDAEPLSYPFFGIFGNPSPHRPEFIYFNRLATMSFSERMEYYKRSLDRASDYSKVLFAQKSKLYTFLNGDKERNIPSAMEEAMREAHTRAHQFLYAFLEKNNYDSITSVSRMEEVLNEGLRLYRNDVERLFIVLVTKRIIDLIKTDTEARTTLRYIYSFLVPEQFKGSNNRHKKVVFIDSGIKGSLALLLASLILADDLERTDADKSEYLEKLADDINRLRKFNIRARVFMYGTTEQYRSTVPNAGFERFGFGGANSFIEKLPKFATSDSLNAKGMPRCVTAGDINVSRSNAILNRLRWYAGRKDVIRHAGSSDEVEDIITDVASKSKNPIYLFVDLDNVILQPIGYVGSNTWYGDKTSAIPDREGEKKLAHFAYYKKYMQHLVETGGYETLLDIAGLMDNLRRRFPDRELKIVCFSARNESQREVTERTLNMLGIYKYFDEINLSQRIGMTKKERLLEYLSHHGIKTAKDTSVDIFVIDDALHHLAPFLSLDGIRVVPVLFSDSRRNYSDKSGLWFFEKGNTALQNNDISRAKEYYINAFKNSVSPLTADDVTTLEHLCRDRKDMAKKLLNAFGWAYPWLDDEDLTRANRLFKELYGAPPCKEQIELWNRIEKCARNYDKNREFFITQGFTKEKAIENTVLDFAFEFGNKLEPPQYAVQFIQLLVPYFSKEEIIDFFPEGSVFKEQFQWIENASEDDYEFYYGGIYFLYHHDPHQGRRYFIKARSYQELKIQHINRLLLQHHSFTEQHIKSIMVFPTLYCNVACPICLYSCQPEPAAAKKADSVYLSSQSISRAVELINSYKHVETLVIGGGGEPFLEFDAVAKLVANADVSTIKIYTSGDWGKNMAKVNQYLLGLYRALASRKKPVHVELNVSADEFHRAKISGEDNVDYLVNILSAFVKAREHGRFPNVSLHLRGLSKDGNISDKTDTIDVVLDRFRKKHPNYPLRIMGGTKERYNVEVKQDILIQVSYNKLMKNTTKAAQAIMADVRREKEGFLFDRILINGDDDVSLGGYYKAVPLGKLREASPAILAGLSTANIISEAVRLKGLRYILNLAQEYDPYLARFPPPSATKVELVKNIMADPKRQLYIYYRVLLDLCKEGVLDTSLLPKFGMRLDMDIGHIRDMSEVDTKAVLTREKTRKLNWGFQCKENISEPFLFANIWWDACDTAGRKTMNKKIGDIQNKERITSFIEHTLKQKYALDSVDIKSMTAVGGYLSTQTKRVPVKDLDLVVVVGNKGIRDFIPETPFLFGDTFALGAGDTPQNICVWILSEEDFSPSADNIIDIDLAMTVLNGMPVLGNLPQNEAVPIIERIKQTYLFLNLLLKMNSDMDVVKLYKRKAEIDSILEQLRQISISSKKTLLASPNISPIDKEHIDEVLTILKDYYAWKVVFDLRRAWWVIDQLYRLTTEKIDEHGDAISDSQLDIILSAKRREILEYVQKTRKKTLELIEQLYRLQEHHLVTLPVQKPRRWLVNIFKANTPSRSLREHLNIATSTDIDYSTAISLAHTTPYPSALRSLYKNVISDTCVLNRDQKYQVSSLIANNPCIPADLQHELGADAVSDRDIAIAELLLPASLDISAAYRQRFLDYLIHLNCKGGHVSGNAEENLGKKGALIRKYIEKLLMTDVRKLERLYDKYHAFYNRYCAGYLGPMVRPHRSMTSDEREILKEQMTHLVAVITNRVLYSRMDGIIPLYEGLTLKEFEDLIGNITRQVIAFDREPILFNRSDRAVREVLERKRIPCPGKKLLTIGVLSCADKEGPSVSNRLNIQAMQEYLLSNGVTNIDFKVFDLQFVKPDNFLKQHFDVLVLDVRQENFETFSRVIDEWPLEDMAEYFLIEGSYLALPGSLDIIQNLTQDKLPDAMIVSKEAEPALLGLADHILNRERPILLIPNISFGTSQGELRTPSEKTDLSRIRQRLYPYTEQMKNSPWFNYFIETSRGCHYGRCTFCIDRLLHGPGWRGYPVESVLETFKELNKSGIETVFIQDKDFWGGDYQRAEKIARGLIEMGNRVRYTVALRADEIIEGEHLLDLFKKSGLSLVFIGPESFEDTTLKRLEKGVDSQINMEAIRILREHDIDFGLGFMIDPLCDIDELAESLRLVERHKLWGYISSLFNIVRVKRGMAYAHFMKRRELLGGLSEDRMTYESGFKDSRVAVLGQSISDCLREVPRLNFIYIIAKRRIALNDQKDFKEREKYDRHFQMLNRVDFDFLLSLIELVRFGHQDKIEDIKGKYISDYKKAVERIKAELDPEHPVSKNILEYIKTQIALKEKELEPEAVPFPKRVEAAYEGAHEATKAMVRESRVPAPYVPKEGFNLSIVSGVSDISGDLCDFTTDLRGRLQEISSGLEDISGDTFLAMPQGRYRISLFNRYINEPASRWDEIKQKPEVLKDLRRAIQDLSYILPIKVSLKGLLLTEQGAVVVKGFVEDDSIERLRQILNSQFPYGSRDIHLDRPFISITLGRINKEITPNRFRLLAKEVEKYNDEDFGTVVIRRPILEASSDFTGFVAHQEAQQVLQPLNEQLLNRGPRLLLANMYNPPAIFGISSLSQYRFPLTLNTLKGFVQKAYGDTVDVTLLDRQREKETDRLINLVKSGRFDLVGFTVRIGEEKEITEILDRIYGEVEESERPMIVLGNTLPGQNITKFLHNYPGIIIVRGEGEYALRGLIEHLRGKKELKDIPNISYLENGKIKAVPIVPIAAEDFAMPTFEGLERNVRLGGLVQWEASRGCPWGRCRFCNRLHLCKGWRSMPLELVLDGLEVLQKRGVQQVFFADEDFIGLDYDHAIAFAKGIIERGIKMDFIFSTSVRDVYREKDNEGQMRKKREHLSLLKEAGVSKISIGLESGSEEQLSEYGKGVTVNENRQAVNMLRGMGFEVIPSFIMFYPFMSVNNIMENLSFITELGIEEDMYIFGKLRVCDAHNYFKERLEKEGLLRGKGPDGIHYKYEFQDKDVANIVAKVTKWKGPRKRYNETFNDDLVAFAEYGDYLTAVYRSLQKGIRKADLGFLKIIALCFHSQDDSYAFLDSLRVLGFDGNEIRKLLGWIQSHRQTNSETDRQKLLAQITKVFVEKRLSYLKGLLNDVNMEYRKSVEENVRSIVHEKLSQAVDFESEEILSNFGCSTADPKVTRITLIGFTHQKHYIRRNDLSIECLGGDLRGEFGEEVDVLIKRVRDEKELERLISDMQSQEMPDVIGISAHLGSLQFVDRFMRFLQQNESFKQKESLVVFGDQIPTYFPEQMLQKYPEVVVVRGEGEEPLRGLVEYARGAVDLSDIPNLVYVDKESGSPVYTEFKFPDLSKLIHPPAMDTVDQIIAEGGHIMCQTGRGCSWGRCAFCSKASFRHGGKMVRGKQFNCWDGLPIQRVLDTFEALYKKGIDYVEIVDEDQFIVSRDPGHLERLEAITDGLKQLTEKYGRKMEFLIFVRPETIYRTNDESGNDRIKQLLTKLKEVGLIRVFLSADSGCREQIKRYSKGINLAQIEGSKRLVEEQELDVRIGFIMFDPELTLDDMIANIKFFRKYNLVRYNQSPHRSLEVFVGTPIVERLRKKGLLGELDINYLRYQYRFEYPEVERIYHIMKNFSAETMSLHGSCNEANKYFVAHNMDKETKLTQQFLEDIGNIYLDLMEELALNIKDAGETQISKITEKAKRRVRDLEDRIAEVVDLGPFLTEKLRDLSRGYVDEIKDTHPALEKAANEGRMFAVILGQIDKLQELNNEELADLFVGNLVRLRSPPQVRHELLEKLKNYKFKENLLKGFQLMKDSAKSHQLPQDKPIRLSIVIEDEDFPTIVFKDPYNNLIAHSGRGQKTNIPYTSIYAGYRSLKIAMETDKETDFRGIISHEAQDIVRGYCVDKETEEVSELYDDVLGLHDARAAGVTEKTNRLIIKILSSA